MFYLEIWLVLLCFLTRFRCVLSCFYALPYVLKKLALSRRNVFVLRSMRISCVLLLSRLDLLVFYSVLGGRAYLRIFCRFYAKSWICTICCVFRTYIFIIFVFSTRCSDTIPRVLQCFQHRCRFSERVSKSLARSRRNACILRSVCISCVLRPPRVDFLVFYSALGRAAYLLVFYSVLWCFKSIYSCFIVF